METLTFISHICAAAAALRIRFTLLFIFAAISCAGCAKIAEPEPPAVRIPKPATDLAARQVSDFVVLSVSKSESNTDGSEAKTLKSVDVYRLRQNGKDGGNSFSEEQFIKSATRILSIPSTRFSQFLRDRVFVFQDKFPIEKATMYSHTFQYAVLFVNTKKQSAGLSNRVSVTPVPIPPPPGGVTAQCTQRSIRLRWTAPTANMDGSTPPRNAGYNIYRSEVPDSFPTTPLNPAPVQNTEFEDLNFRFDATYYYAITTVGSLQQPYPESLRSTALSIAAKDIFQPAPPSDFTALFQGNTVILLWAPSPSADLDGYRIYKKEKGAGDRRLVQKDLIRSLSFRDSNVEPGKIYDYEIQAVDTHGNASDAVEAESEQR